MDIELLSGACGAEILGIDLRDTSDGNIKIIKDLLFEHKVIFFRNQDIAHQEQIDLSKCFGPIEKHAYVKGLPEYENSDFISKFYADTFNNPYRKFFKSQPSELFTLHPMLITK